MSRKEGYCLSQKESHWVSCSHSSLEREKRKHTYQTILCTLLSSFYSFSLFGTHNIMKGRARRKGKEEWKETESAIKSFNSISWLSWSCSREQFGRSWCCCRCSHTTRVQSRTVFDCLVFIRRLRASVHPSYSLPVIQPYIHRVFIHSSQVTGRPSLPFSCHESLSFSPLDWKNTTVQERNDDEGSWTPSFPSQKVQAWSSRIDSLEWNHPLVLSTFTGKSIHHRRWHQQHLTRTRNTAANMLTC